MLRLPSLLPMAEAHRDSVLGILGREKRAGWRGGGAKEMEETRSIPRGLDKFTVDRIDIPHEN